MSSRGMNQKCKISLKISRRNVLLLRHIIEAGLSAGNDSFGDDLMSALPPDSLEEFKIIHEEILEKRELIGFYARLKLI